LRRTDRLDVLHCTGSLLNAPVRDGKAPNIPSIQLMPGNENFTRAVLYRQ